MKAKRTLLIGWDAADWRVIRPLIKEGKMPNLKQLLDSGCGGNIETLHPVLSPMLWTSIATGKRPYKHGIYGFSEPDSKSNTIRPITNLSRKSKAVWNIFQQNDLKSNIVGWWPSHPVEPISGVMVSNHFQSPPKEADKWPVRPGTIQPERLVEHLKDFRLHPTEVEGNILELFVPRAREIDQEKDTRLLNLAKVIAEISSVHAAGTAIMQLESWDFMAVYYDGIDHFGHGFMKYHPPHNPRVSKEDFEMYQHVIEAGYRYHDMILGTLMQLAGEETNIILMSDHGFHPDHLRPLSLPDAPAGPAAEHRNKGILVMSGPDFKTGGEEIHSAGLLDITPTLLHLYGLPVGEDMDGRVLDRALKEDRPVSFISSWEKIEGEDGSHPKDKKLDPQESQHALQQLVDLGYIDKPDEDNDLAIKNTIRELDYNLAQSYVDGKKYIEARTIARNLYDEWPEESRFGLLELQCDFAIKNVAQVRETYEKVKTRKFEAAEKADESIQALLKEQTDKGIADIKNYSKEDAQQLRKLKAKASIDNNALDYFEAKVLLLEGQDVEAAKIFKDLLKSAPGRRLSIHLSLANICLGLDDIETAKENALAAVELDSDHSEAHLILSRCFLKQQSYLNAASHALESIKLNYNNPRAHYFYAKSLCHLDHVKWAVEALDVAVTQTPHFPDAHKLLSKLYRENLKKKKLAAYHEELAKEAEKYIQEHRTEEFTEDAKEGVFEAQSQLPKLVVGKVTNAPAEYITVVSGLPRSGTSMAMQLLEAAGIPVLTDEAREADESNKKGYYEFEAVKKFHKDSSCLQDAKGKSLKIVVPLVRFLSPEFQYKVIFMERSPTEIFHSQQKMIEVQKGKKSLRQDVVSGFLYKQSEECKKMLVEHPNCDLLVLNYNEALKNPEATIERLKAFFPEFDVDMESMQKVVDPSLYYSK